MRRLVDALVQFERYIEEDAPLETVLPSICEKYPGRYQDYTLRRLCQEMHDLYVSFDAKQLQREMFRQSYLPRMAMNPQEANMAFVRGEIELLPRRDVSPPKARCLIPLGCCAWCLARCGADRRGVISWRWRRD